jgi:hypothetical protein
VPRQPVVITQRRRADLQDRFRTLRIVPKHLRAFDAVVDLFDQRPRLRGAGGAAGFPILQAMA